MYESEIQQRDSKRLAAFELIKGIEHELERIEQFTQQLTADLQPYLYPNDAKPQLARSEEPKLAANSQLTGALTHIREALEHRANRLLELLERVQ